MSRTLPKAVYAQKRPFRFAPIPAFQAATQPNLTSGLTLVAGDVVLTGTPAGVGYARKPPLFMKPGDVVEVTIEKVATLRNTVRDEG